MLDFYVYGVLYHSFCQIKLVYVFSYVCYCVNKYGYVYCIEK